MKAIGQVLAKTDLSDKDTLVALLLCECRILFKNHELVSMVEGEFKQAFKAVHQGIKERQGSVPEVAQAIQDVTKMVDLE